VLFGNPEKTSPDLSPDATRLAYLAPSVGKDVLNVWVKTIGKDDDRQVTNDTHRGIRSFFWAEVRRDNDDPCRPQTLGRRGVPLGWVGCSQTGYPAKDRGREGAAYGDLALVPFRCALSTLGS